MSKKKIIMFVYSDITTDARVQRAAEALCDVFDVVVISKDCNKAVQNSNFKSVLVGNGNVSRLSYVLCVIDAIRIIKKERPSILYGHDYYSSMIVHHFLNRKHCSFLAYDAHELYIPEKGKKIGLRMRFFYNLERLIVKRVDALFCANEERANIMFDHYALKTKPTVIRNISKLGISHDEGTESILSSLSSFFSKSGVTVVYAGAIINSRKLDGLVKAVAKHPDKFKLLMVGNGDALNSLKSIASSFEELNYCFLGAVPYRSLGALLSRCDIGYLHYPIDSLNNIYCASNKIYEYASVNLPILASPNPTVKKIIENNGIGICSEDLESGLLDVLTRMEFFKSNSCIFNKKNRWEEDANLLRQTILSISK